MKQEDFERLKAVCEKEGFDLELSSPWDQTYRISKKDIWEGVEFVEVTQDGKYLKKGSIYKILDSAESSLGFHLKHYKVIETTQDGVWVCQEILKPSTEQAYIEQLKKEAFERFGEIKSKDCFIME